MVLLDDVRSSCSIKITISLIATLPQAIPNAYVISTTGCPQSGDNLHFTAAGYRELGERYALKMPSLLSGK